MNAALVHAHLPGNASNGGEAAHGFVRAASMGLRRTFPRERLRARRRNAAAGGQTVLDEAGGGVTRLDNLVLLCRPR